MSIHQVFLDFRLAVDGDDLAGQAFEVDPQAPSVEGELHAGMDQPLARQPVADADFGQHVDRALLEQSRADARAQVFGRPPLQHHSVDARLAQHPREQQAGRAGADNSNSSSHRHCIAKGVTFANAVVWVSNQLAGFARRRRGRHDRGENASRQPRP